MAQSIEETLISVWRQTLIDGASSVEVDGKSYPVRTTPRRKLKQIDFPFDGRELRGVEQNPETKSQWAALARKGKKVMHFLESGRYIGVVADGQTDLIRQEEIALPSGSTSIRS